MSSRRCRHIWIRRAKFSMTLPHSFLGIALIATVIAAFRSGIVWGLLPYTLSLRYPRRQKSGRFKSGECGDHCGSHLRLISSTRNAAVAMPMIRLRSGGGTILLEPLEDPDDPSPSNKCCPELAKHLDMSLGVDCHRPLVVVLEPE